MLKPPRHFDETPIVPETAKDESQAFWLLLLLLPVIVGYFTYYFW